MPKPKEAPAPIVSDTSSGAPIPSATARFDVDQEMIDTIKEAHAFVREAVRTGRRHPREVALLARLDKVLTRIY